MMKLRSKTVKIKKNQFNDKSESNKLDHMSHSEKKQLKVILMFQIESYLMP